MSEEELPSDTAVQCADVIGDSEPVVTIASEITSTADQAPGETNCIVPVTVDERSTETESTYEQMLAAYAAGVNVRVICEESNVLWSQTALIVKDQIAPLKRVWENTTNRSGQATNLNVNDEAEATLRKAITDSARQIGLINTEMKKLRDMLKEWIPAPGSADSKREDTKAVLDELMKKNKEVEQDLRVQVATRDALIKQMQEDLKEQMNAKDELLKQMQEDHRAEVEKSNANTEKLKEELTWKNEAERLQTELDKMVKQNKEIQREQNSKEDKMKTEVESLRNEVKDKECQITWMDVKIKHHEKNEKNYTKEFEQAKNARDRQIVLLNDLLKMKGTETLNLQKEKQEALQSKNTEMEDLQKTLSEKDNKIQELEKHLETNSDEFHQSEQPQNAEELKRKDDEITELHSELQKRETEIDKLEIDRKHLKEKCKLLKKNSQTATKLANVADKAMDKIPDAKQQPMASSNATITATMIHASATTTTTTNLPDQIAPTDALEKTDKLVKTDSSSSSE